MNPAFSLPGAPNRLSRTLAKLNVFPVAWRPVLVSWLLGRVVPMVGRAGLRFEEIRAGRVVVRIRNRRAVQNHIQGVHAAGMALAAETATGFCLGMCLPDDKLPLIKLMKIDYVRRAQGDLVAVAQLQPEQMQHILTQDKGEVRVPVVITDESGQEPIRAEMLWAWVPKVRR